MLSPFTATTAPLVRTLLEEITDMRKYFAGMGLEVGKLDGSGWLNATIGTYFGVGFAVNFLSTFDADAELPEGLSTLQRMVAHITCRTLVRAIARAACARRASAVRAHALLILAAHGIRRD